MRQLVKMFAAAVFSGTPYYQHFEKLNALFLMWALDLNSLRKMTSFFIVLHCFFEVRAKGKQAVDKSTACFRDRWDTIH